MWPLESSLMVIVPYGPGENGHWISARACHWLLGFWVCISGWLSWVSSGLLAHVIWILDVFLNIHCKKAIKYWFYCKRFFFIVFFGRSSRDGWRLSALNPWINFQLETVFFRWFPRWLTLKCFESFQIMPLDTKTTVFSQNTSESQRSWEPSQKRWLSGWLTLNIPES